MKAGPPVGMSNFLRGEKQDLEQSAILIPLFLKTAERVFAAFFGEVFLSSQRELSGLWNGIPDFGRVRALESVRTVWTKEKGSRSRPPGMDQ